MPSMISLVSVDVDPAVEAAFNRWYNEVHVPEVLGCPGWISGARYRSVAGEPHYLAMYGITGEDAMWTPELFAIRGFGRYWKDLTSYRSRMYRRLGPERDGADEALPTGLICIVTVDVEATVDAPFNDWYD